MKNFKQILLTCHNSDKLSKSIIDDYLIYYVAVHENLDSEMDSRLSVYRHIVQKLPSMFTSMIKAQYIAHKIFAEGGLIKKYFRKGRLKEHPPEAHQFLTIQIDNPWKFRFSVILDSPAEHFYEMLDVFRDEKFLLYSPSVTKTLSEYPVILWFNLTGFNGMCHQTYGPICGYQSFDEDDIFFFATERNPKIENEDDLLQDVHNNPFPYLMLISGSRIPRTFHNGDEIVHLWGTVVASDFYTDPFRKDFDIEYNRNVFRLALKGWQEYPHFAIAYYNEKTKELMATALTDSGYEALADRLAGYGMDVPQVADVRVRLSMVSITEDILKKEIVVNPYEHLFNRNTDPQEDAFIEKINRVMQLVLPYLNDDKEPDIDALATQAGVAPEEVREAIEGAIAHIKKMKR